MIHFDDLTEAELAFRALLTRKKSDFERRNTPFSIWCQQAREAWAQRPEGKRAIAEAEAKAGKVRRRVVGGEPSGA
jgi:hypothetical protein